MFLKRQNPHALVVAMTGVKMGDRLLYVGCGSGPRLGAVAAKVGLSGRAVAIVPDEASAARAPGRPAGAGARGGVRLGPPRQLPPPRPPFHVAPPGATPRLVGAPR